MNAFEEHIQVQFCDIDGAIINTILIIVYHGSHHLIDYAANKGAIFVFTRSLTQSLAEQGIRVNAVVPGPV